jgi:hypothetical protein
LNATCDRIVSSPEDIQADTDKMVVFVSMYCDRHHGHRKREPFNFSYAKVPALVKKGPSLCAGCTRLLRHAIVMRALCPLCPKPKCRKCPQHCYRPVYREQMERVMKYSGPRSIFRKR